MLLSRSLCVFCGSSEGAASVYADIADEVGRICARNRWTLIYGGARIGLMGRVADSCLQHDGNVIGIIPEHLHEREIAHNGLSELYITKSMHERQQKMSDLADGFLILPGGLGTLAEFFEALTWKQIGLHTKPIGVLNVNHYWNFLKSTIDKAAQEGFASVASTQLYDMLGTVKEAEEYFYNHFRS